MIVGGCWIVANAIYPLNFYSG